MIEIEIKCKPTLEQKAALLSNAIFVSEKHITDIYYDSTAYELTIKDFWLRKRNGKFELKIPASSHPILASQANTPKHEIENEHEIRTALNLSTSDTLEQDLLQAGYKPLYTLTKTRTKYTCEEFVIDIDHATFETLTFDLCEIETMVESADDITTATEQLVAFAQRFGITLDAVPGNLIALIMAINPTHYEILERARTERLQKKSID
jgi:predicted adenylyl cyclase CyaB